jgi:hypothetical protein
MQKPYIKYVTPFQVMFAVIKTFVTDISGSTGRNDFIFHIWLLHGDFIKSFLPVEAEISVTKVSITANMNNSKSHGKQEVDVR